MSQEQTIRQLFSMVDDAADEIVALLQALVRIPTVNTGARESGNEIAACRYLEQVFAAEGIASRTYESAPTRGNLVARYGSGQGPSLLLMSHVDVVPIEDESKWQRAPFSGEIVDGKVYGRGSDDAKSLAASGAMALILLKRAAGTLGVELAGDTRFLAAADEEAGGVYGIQWMAKEHPEEVGTDFAVNEGGGLHLDTPAGLAYQICVGEKGRLEARFTLRGRSGHAAWPWRADNALYKLATLLERLKAYQPEIDLRIPVFSHLAMFGIQETPTPKTLDGLIASLRGSNDALADMLHASSRMTVTPTMTQAGIKSNSIPAAATLTCDIRCLPHHTPDYVRGELEKIAAGIDGVEIDLQVTAVANASDYDSPFVKALQRSTELALGRDSIHWLPGVTTGFTDSRALRPLGTQTFGFSPLLPESPTLRPGVHGVDEAFEIDNLIFRTKQNIALAYLTTGPK